MKTNDITILIGGEAGAGIFRSGFVFGKTCMRGGLNVFGTNDYQSLIRGGHNYYIARVKDDEVFSQKESLDLLISLNFETIIFHKNNLVSGGGIIYDPDDKNVNSKILGREDLSLFPVPLRKIVEDRWRPIMSNTVALGAAVALLDYDLSLLKGVLNDTFNKRVAQDNIEAAIKGYNYLEKNVTRSFSFRLRKIENYRNKKIFLSGSDAIGLGALKAGCKFYSAYPMTPSTGVLHFMASQERDFDLVVIQPEGEIAAINMAIGASFSGTRSMTSTSGGGFCLMSEGLGMSGMTESPIVIMVAQRLGPSTGLPTYTAQGDLRFCLHASQGDFPRVVIAPGNIQECFYETMRAFNLAEIYQIPVILLTDKYLVESQIACEPFNTELVKIKRGNLIEEEFQGKEDYMRYKFTETGISPRATPPNVGAIVRTNADEHDESGLTTEDGKITKEMMDKRMRKIRDLIRDLDNGDIKGAKLYGPKNAEVSVISWGSTKGPIREAATILRAQDVIINFLQIIYLAPFPNISIKNFLSKSNYTIAVEQNYSSHLCSLIREHLMIDVDDKILKYDGRPFDPHKLADQIKEVL